MEANIEANGDKLSSLKHHIDKMEGFYKYFRDQRVAERYKRAIVFLRDELYESVDVD